MGVHQRVEPAPQLQLCLHTLKVHGRVIEAKTVRRISVKSEAPVAVDTLDLRRS